MLEKINSYLGELTGLHEEYKKQKPWFRQKNGDVLIELKKNKKKIDEVRSNIQEYDDSSFLGKLWISLRYPIGYYKELIQYYELNELTQQAISMPAEERVFFIDDIASFLEKFSIKNIKETILRIYNGLLDIKTKYNKGFDADIFPVFSIEKGKAKDVVTVSPDKAPENLQEVKFHNIKIVRNMICLLKEMQMVDWGKLSAESKGDAENMYRIFMRKFDVALKGYSHLRILTHPDHHGNNESADLFRELQETYKKFKAHKENIEKYVSVNGLASLNGHIPKEEQSAKELLETLNATLDEIIAKYNKHFKIFDELLPQQTEEVKILSEKIKAHSELVVVISEENAKQDAHIGHLEGKANAQSEELYKLREDKNLQAAQLKEQVTKANEFDRKMQLLIEQQVAKLMGETSQTEETNNDNTSTGGAFFERRNFVVYKEENTKSDDTNSDKKEPSLG